jgi:pimeloyl-ACP methyl ester carboxylesterase
MSTALPSYRIISVNLFFHGGSQRNHPQKYLKHDEWKFIFTGFLEHIKVEKFSILGYSLGGRYVISTMYSFSEQIAHCILIASDGIVKRFWYEFATSPTVPEFLFRYFMGNPKPFFQLMDLLEKSRLMNPSTIKFARTQLRNEEKREQVFQSWVTLKKLRLPLRNLIPLINSKQFSTTIIFGEYDRIINQKNHSTFLKKLETASISIVESSHHEMINSSLSEIKKALSQ